MTSIPSSAASGLSPSPPPPPPAPSAGHAKNLSVSSSTFSAHDTPTASTATSSAVRRASVPSDRVRLDLLLTTGQRAAFDFGQDASIVDVKQELWNSWPQGEYQASATPIAEARQLNFYHLCYTSPTCSLAYSSFLARVDTDPPSRPHSTRFRCTGHSISRKHRSNPRSRRSSQEGHPRACSDFSPS